MKLKNKNAIVTGAAQGIGRAIAQRYLQEGAKVVVSDVNDEKCQKTAEKLKEFGEVVAVHTDVRQTLDVHNLVASAEDEFGEIDILVNNAGIAIGGDLFDIKEEEFDKVIDVNLKGGFLCSQAVAKHMVDRVKNGGPAGCIINMSSTNAKLAIPSQIPYTISKGGVRQMTNVLAQYLAPHGIRVNAIGPGSIDTSMLASVNESPEAKKRLLWRTPMGRIGTVEEVAGIATFLASDDASYVTGQTVYVDGGRLGLAYVMLPDDQ